MSKGTLFLISISLLLTSVSQSCNGQSKKNADTVEVINNEEFIKFFISTVDFKKNKQLEIRISSEYSRNKDIIDVIIRSDTIVSIKKQELVYNMPKTIQGSELLTDTVHFEKNILINNGVGKFCQEVSRENSNLLIEFCSYLSVLRSMDEKTYLKYF